MTCIHIHVNIYIYIYIHVNIYIYIFICGYIYICAIMLLFVTLVLYRKWPGDAPSMFVLVETPEEAYNERQVIYPTGTRAISQI